MRSAERRTPFPALRPSLSTSSLTGPWREDEPAARKVTVATMAREGQETHAEGVGAGDEGSCFSRASERKSKLAIYEEISLRPIWFKC